MNIVITTALALVVGGGVGVGGFFLYSQMQDGSVPKEDYRRSEIYAQCDKDYLQSARHLGFRAEKSDCECFDQKLQKLTTSQRKMAYKSLEYRLTLAFMSKAGAKVSGDSVTFNDGKLGKVNAELKIDTSGKAIIEQCSMF